MTTDDYPGIPDVPEGPETGKGVQTWGDAHQYAAEPMPADATQGVEHQGVMPRVTLLTMTDRPLSAVAAMCAMYEGRVVRDFSEMNDRYVMAKWKDVQETHLRAPLEAVKLHFLIEGVDRAFTHQLVRQRTAVYAQESLRFAVVGDLSEATSLPPSLAGTHGKDWVGSDEWVEASGKEERRERWRNIWDGALQYVDDAYHRLVESGMPAEEARGLLPHCTTTRVHYVTDLRNLAEHAGNRLCTQAQFHWRVVFSQIVKAIREYGPPCNWCGSSGIVEEDHGQGAKESLACPQCYPDREQYVTIANSNLFRPVCYAQGKCPFKASFDRGCTIRERVDIRSKHGGTDSSQWVKPFMYENPKPAVGESHYLTSEGIRDEEWLLNPGAARA